MAFVRDIAQLVWDHENQLCLEALSGLPLHERAFEYTDDTGLGDLLGFAHKALNPDPTSFMVLDTVFMPHELFLKSDPNDTYGNYVIGPPNVAAYPPMFGLGHESIPANTLYVTSSAHGPRFINAPITLTCTESEFLVGCYSRVVLPPTGGSAVSYGFKIDIKDVS